VTNKTAAARYARALFDVAVKEKADLEQIERDLRQFADLFTAYPQLEKVLLNPAVPVQRKRAAVVDLLGHATFSPIVSKLLTMLAERDRLVLLRDLLNAYGERVGGYLRRFSRRSVLAEKPAGVCDPHHSFETGIAALREDRAVAGEAAGCRSCR